MQNQVTIANIETTILAYKGIPICLTKQVSMFYSCTEKNLSDNYQNNSGRFKEGDHFFKIEGEDLRIFRLSIPDNIGSPLKFANSLILWTEKGVALHAKMLTTDKAWQVYEEMVDVYFAVKDRSLLTAPVSSPLVEQIQAGTFLFDAFARAARLSPSAIALGYQKLAKKVGFDDLIPGYAIDAPTSSATGSSEPTSSATEMLKKRGVKMSARIFNLLLEQHGFIEKLTRPSKSKGEKSYWSVKNLEYGKNSTPTQNQNETQPLWYISKFDELLELVLPKIANDDADTEQAA